MVWRRLGMAGGEDEKRPPMRPSDSWMLSLAGWEQERMKKHTPDDPGWVVARAMGIAVIYLLLSTFKLVTITQRRKEKYQTTCLPSFWPGFVAAAHFKRSLCCQKKQGN